MLSVPFTGAYSASKFALKAISDALRVELKPWGIPVSLVAPGAMDTDIRFVAMQGWGEQRGGLSPAERELYGDMYEKLQVMIDTVQKTAAPHEHVTEAVLDALTAQSPLLALSDDERDEALKMFE
jgi:short-subunit dehydrogenase